MINNKNSRIISSLGLPKINDIFDLSKQIRLSSRLLYCLSMKTDDFYKVLKIPKKDGTLRTIYAPTYTLSIVQKWILVNILYKVQPSNRAMAFRVGNRYGCKANARYHLDTLFGLGIDLEDFFPSIQANKVYTLFNDLGYDSLPATILTNLCTLYNELPQGAVCSPAISNLVCRSLDNRLIGLCEKRGIRYTRYADDMYFSCDNKDLLHKIYPIIQEIIKDEGFKLNKKKTHYHTPSGRKQITGIVVSKKPGDLEDSLEAKKIFKKEVRASIHKAIMTGDYSNSDRILGLVSHINYIEGETDRQYLIKIKKYIVECVNKIVNFKELVEAFNANKLYKDISDIEYQPIAWDSLENYEIYELFEILDSREDYLKKIGENDICSYLGWPSFLMDRHASYKVTDEEYPFS